MKPLKKQDYINLYLEIGRRDLIVEYLKKNIHPEISWNGFKTEIKKLKLSYLDKYLRKTNKYYLDRCLFRNLTNESAYVLGYIIGDGCLQKDYNAVIISSVDKQILEEIKKVFDTDYPIRLGDNHLKNPDWQKLWSFTVRDPLIYEDLESFGIYQRKSYIGCDFKFEKLPEKFMGHFLRGLLDSDGSIQRMRCAKKGNGVSCHFLADASIINYIKEFLRKELNIFEGSISKQRFGHNLYNFCFGNTASLKILDFIYKGKGSLYLKRKFDLYQGLLKKQLSTFDKQEDVL